MYDDGFNCDCGCGEHDPDCNTNNSAECDTCDEFNCFASSEAECKANLDPFDNGVCD